VSTKWPRWNLNVETQERCTYNWRGGEKKRCGTLRGGKVVHPLLLKEKKKGVDLHVSKKRERMVNADKRKIQEGHPPVTEGGMQRTEEPG